MKSLVLPALLMAACIDGIRVVKSPARDGDGELAPGTEDLAEVSGGDGERAPGTEESLDEESLDENEAVDVKGARRRDDRRRRDERRRDPRRRDERRRAPDDRRRSSGGGDCEGSESDYRKKSDLLDELKGHGEDSKGGKNGKIFVVDTTDDSSSKCSLRKALESSSAYWIVFHKNLKGDTIKLDKTIKVKSEKTVAGYDSGITIRAPPGTKSSCDASTALEIEKQSDIIISDVKFDGNTDKWDKDNECADAIYMEASERIVIHRNDFFQWPDSAVEVRIKDGKLNKDISITNNHIKNIYQAFVISGDPVTFGENWCENVRKRCVKVFDGKVHSYNNAIEGWGDIAIQNVDEDGQLYSHNNMFDQSDNPSNFKEANKVKGKLECSGNKVVGGDVDFNKCNGGVSSDFKSKSEKNVKVESAGSDRFKKVKSNAGART